MLSENEGESLNGRHEPSEEVGDDVLVVTKPHELLEFKVYVDLRQYCGWDLKLKCEGLNFAGSLKLRSAAGLVAEAEESGRLDEHSTIIESSSGNMGLALAMIAANKRIPFICVTDPHCNRSTLNLIRSLGAELVIVADPDSTGGYLQSRLDYVRLRCEEDPRLVWLNQYNNPANWIAHFNTTAPSIAKAFPNLDLVFVGVGTSGTAMGCARYFKSSANRVRVIAVDAVGSVTFGGDPGPRAIPGIGASVRPGLLDPSVFADVVHVGEKDSVRTCRDLARSGFLFGGSTGTVVSGAIRWLGQYDPQHRLSAVAISPDFADRYFDTIYDDAWVEEQFGIESKQSAINRVVNHG